MTQDYFVYNDVTSTDLGLYVEDYTVPPVSSLKYSHVDVPGRHGSARGGSGKLRDKFLMVKCGIVGDDPDDLQVKISGVTKLLQEPGLLHFWDKPAFKYEAVLETSTDVMLEDFWGEFTLMFRVHPLKIGPAVSIPSTSSPITINNPGTAETKGVITVTMTGSTSFLRVQLVETGELIYIEDSFVSGNVVEINLETKKVRKNGVLIMDKVYFTSDYFEIPSGESTISLSSGTATIDFETRWY